MPFASIHPKAASSLQLVAGGANGGNGDNGGVDGGREGGCGANGGANGTGGSGGGAEGGMARNPSYSIGSQTKDRKARVAVLGTKTN
eukprot:4849175-Prymnesium_polylepis.1